MPLTPGTRLGPYEVLSALGAGGMGEVYRARDTRLSRDVAIKVLPQHLSSDPELRARFEREARAISRVSHPHICVLHDIGRDGDTDYLVMELVEGESLADRLTRGALPVADVLRIGAQVADALDRAHRAGVIHRDLKPGNVMLGKSGAKLMDFGLARAAGLNDGGAKALSMTQSPTMARPLTAEGSLVGTFQYMAPEQLEGKEADARSDVWALGCVLYEMSTGKRAFEGASAASLISAILKDEPRPIAEIAPMSPASLERIVHACLAKDPDQRWQSAHDVGLALGWPPDAAGAQDAGEAGAGAGPTTKFRQLTFKRGLIINARFATDGRTVIYDAAWEGGPHQIHLTRTDSPESTLPPLPSAVLMSVSSRSELALSLDRRFLGGWWLGSGMLAQAPLFGGTPREVASEVYEADWLPDGNALAVSRRSGLENVVEFPLGNPVFTSTGWLTGLRVSPDGRHVAFIDMVGVGHGSILRIVDQAGAVRTPGPMGFWFGGLVWKPDGSEIYFVQSKAPEGATLEAIDLDGRRRHIERFMGGYVTIHDMSPAGDMLLTRAAQTYSIACSRPGHEVDVTLGQFDLALAKDISDDGKALLYDEQGVANDGELYTYVGATDGSPPVRLGPGYARELSPDGKWAINIHGSQVRLLSRGAGTPRVLDIAPLNPMHMVSWHPDGERIVMLASEPGHAPRIYILNAAGGGMRPLTPEGVGFPAGAFVKPVSPDGTRICAMSRERELQIYAVSAEGAPLASIQLDEGEEPVRWCADGRSIFVWRRGEVPIRVSRLDLETGKRTPWREYPPKDHTGVICSRSVALTPDGETAAYTYAHMISELFVARGLA